VGNTAEYTGKWDAKTKTLTWTTIASYPSPTTVRIRFIDDDTIEWDVVVKDGAGKVAFRLDGKNTRVKNPVKSVDAEADKLVKELTDMTNQAAALYEKVTDRNSYLQTQPKVEALMQNLAATRKLVEALGPDRRKAALKSNQAHMDQALERLANAQQKATNLGVGGDESRSLDIKALQGTWIATKYNYDGKQVPLEITSKVRIRFTGSSFVMTEENGDVSGEYQILDKKKPAWMDVRITSGANNGKTSLGIIELRDNELVMCFRRPDQERPTEFASTNGAMLLYLKKANQK
jgi:uncharacterized protein (TIGR03067 family)